MANFKFKRGDIITNANGKVLGSVVKSDKNSEDKNKYSLQTEDGEVELLENQIIESDLHKKGKL